MGRAHAYKAVPVVRATPLADAAVRWPAGSAVRACRVDSMADVLQMDRLKQPGSVEQRLASLEVQVGGAGVRRAWGCGACWPLCCGGSEHQHARQTTEGRAGVRGTNGCSRWGDTPSSLQEFPAEHPYTARRGATSRAPEGQTLVPCSGLHAPVRPLSQDSAGTWGRPVGLGGCLGEGVGGGVGMLCEGGADSSLPGTCLAGGPDGQRSALDCGGPEGQRPGLQGGRPHPG